MAVDDPTKVPRHISVTNLLMDAVVDQLTEWLQVVPTQDEIENPDFNKRYEAVAGLIRNGRLQDDPTTYAINILVHPATEEHKDELYDKDVHNAFRLPNQFEIGGIVPNSYWVKHIHAEMTLFFDGENKREYAQTRAQVVLSRAHHALMLLNANFAAIPRDSFGNKAHMCTVKNMYLREDGGPGTFIWRGEILIQFLCSMEPKLTLD